MAGRRNIAAAVALTAALLAAGAPSALAGGPVGDPAGAAAAKKKCNQKKGAKKKKRCKRKLIGSRVTITNCPASPVPNGTPVTIQGILTPDKRGRSPLGAVWESSPPVPSDSAASFFTSPGGAFAFTFTPSQPGATVAWTTVVRVDFAGDLLFADRRPSSATCSFVSTP